jgi:hypothetical protein
MSDLKPCPFCGLNLVEAPNLTTRNSRMFVHPRDDAKMCVLNSVLIQSTNAEKIAAWNRRAPATQTGE